MSKPKTARRAPPKSARLRLVHVYVSLFVAPSLIFFSATGALQTFRLPDKPAAPVLVQKLARLHKDDVFAVKPPRPKPPAGERRREARPPREAPRASTEVLKWFFTAVSIGILATTAFGIWVAFTSLRRKALMWATLLAGTAAPVLILIMPG